MVEFESSGPMTLMSVEALKGRKLFVLFDVKKVVGVLYFAAYFNEPLRGFPCQSYYRRAS